jgi:hypothetical protein
MPILNPRQRVQWDPNQYSSVEFAFAKAGGQGRVSVQQGDSPMSLSVPGSTARPRRSITPSKHDLTILRRERAAKLARDGV